MAEATGRAELVAVARIEPPAMLMFRGDLHMPAIAEGLGKACGIPCPSKGRIAHSEGGSMAWMSPDECLIFVESVRADAVREAVIAELAGQHALCVDVSAMRAMFQIDGEGVRDLLARGSPADASPEALPVGHFRRSRVGQVQAAFWLTEDHSARILCRLSEADYMLNWLNRIASRPGPKHFAPAR